MKILAEISTKDRYFTTLPLTIQSIAFQTRVPDKLLIIDDGEQLDLRSIPLYQHLFRLLDCKGVLWEVIYGKRQGQSINHQLAQDYAITNGFDAVWRIDDDEIAEPDVLFELEKILSVSSAMIGAIGSMIVDPAVSNIKLEECSSKLQDIDTKPNIQWSNEETESSFILAEHLYSSFLYKVGIANYHPLLSKVGHREETLFTYEIHVKGYAVMIAPGVKTWHLRNPEGGIRSYKDENLWKHDEHIFSQRKKGIDEEKNSKVIVLDNGIGDHWVFKKMLDEIHLKHEKVIIACCFPEVFPDEDTISIAEANERFGDITRFNIYKKMAGWQWKGQLIDAYRKLYL